MGKVVLPGRSTCSFQDAPRTRSCTRTPISYSTLARYRYDEHQCQEPCLVFACKRQTEIKRAIRLLSSSNDFSTGGVHPFRSRITYNLLRGLITSYCTYLRVLVLVPEDYSFFNLCIATRTFTSYILWNLKHTSP